MPKEKLPICCNELEEFLVNTCDCASLEAGEIELRNYETYLEKIRPFFVSTLEERVYALLERFIYSEDADRIQEQFPCLKDCIGQARSTRVNENSGNHMAAGIVVQDVITRAIKCLIKEGVFGAFINSLVLNNRINRIGRQLRALHFQKDSLTHINVCNFVCEKNYWIDQFTRCESECNDSSSDLLVEVSNDEDQNFEVLEGSDDESSSSSYQTSSEGYLRTTIAKVQISSCGCVDLVKSKKCVRLKLPCKPGDLMKNIYKVDPNFPVSSFLTVRKEFEDSIADVCSRLNDVLTNLDGGTVNNLCLICEIRPDYISFKLKSLLVEFRDSKSFLFSARVPLSGTNNFRTTISRNSIHRKKLSQKCISYCRQNCLSVVSEEEEDDIDKTDSPITQNVLPEISSETLPEPDTVSENVQLPKVLENSDIVPKLVDVEIIQEESPETPEVNSFEPPNMSCPCEELLSASRQSFSQIDLKLLALSECLKKFTSQNENILVELKIPGQQSLNPKQEILEEEIPFETCLCCEESLQKDPEFSVDPNKETKDYPNVQNQQKIQNRLVSVNVCTNTNCQDSQICEEEQKLQSSQNRPLPENVCTNDTCPESPNYQEQQKPQFTQSRQNCLLLESFCINAYSEVGQKHQDQQKSQFDQNRSVSNNVCTNDSCPESQNRQEEQKPQFDQNRPVLANSSESQNRQEQLKPQFIQNRQNPPVPEQINDNCPENKNRQEQQKRQFTQNLQKREKPAASKIPRRICCPAFAKLKDKEEKQNRLFSCLQRETAKKCTSSNKCSVSKIPVLRKKESHQKTNTPRTSRLSSVNKSSSIPVPEGKHENRSGSIASKKRSTTPSSQRSAELSRCFATKSMIPKSNHLNAKTYNKTSTNVTVIKVNVSSTFLSKANAPQPATRNIPQAPPRRSLQKTDQCVCTEKLPSVTKVDQKISANILPHSDEKPTFLIVTDSEDVMPSCDSECPCRGSFDTPNGSVPSCFCLDQKQSLSAENLKIENPFTEVGNKLKRNLESSNVETFNFEQEKFSSKLSESYSKETNSKTRESKLISPKTESGKTEFLVEKNATREEAFNTRIPILKNTHEKFKINAFEEMEDLSYQSGLMSRDWIFKQNLRTVSIQTMEQRLLTEGININMRETKETVSKGINAVQKEPVRNCINLNIISKNSVTSLHTNVTKIISIIDITIFENGPGLQPFDICGRGICSCYPKLRSLNNSPVKEATSPLPCDSSDLNLLSKSSACPRKELLSTYLPCMKSSPNIPFFIKSSPPPTSLKSKNSRLHLESNVHSTILGKPCHQKIKSCCCGRSKKIGSIDSWLCPKSVARAQNIFKAICEPFSQKSIDRMKYLIRKKLCHLLLNQEGSSSKSFVSSERYYVSVSKEKICSSVGNISSTQYSVTSSTIRRTKRMSGGCDNPTFHDIRKVQNEWKFEGEDKRSIFFNRTLRRRFREADSVEKRYEIKRGGKQIVKGVNGKHRRKVDKAEVELTKRREEMENRNQSRKGERRGYEELKTKEEERERFFCQSEKFVKKEVDEAEEINGINRTVNKQVPRKERQAESMETNSEEICRLKEVKKEVKSEEEVKKEKKLKNEQEVKKEQKVKNKQEVKKEKKVQNEQEVKKEQKVKNKQEVKKEKKLKNKTDRKTEQELKKEEEIKSRKENLKCSKSEERRKKEFTENPYQQTWNTSKRSKHEEKKHSETNFFRNDDIHRSNSKTNRNHIHVKKGDAKKKKQKTFISPGDMITSYHLGKAKFFQSRVQNDDKENGDSKAILQGQFHFNNKGQFSSSEMLKLKGKKRSSRERIGIDESFSDLEQNVKSKLREYVSLCKSVKYLISKSSSNVCGVTGKSNSLH